MKCQDCECECRTNQLSQETIDAVFQNQFEAIAKRWGVTDYVIDVKTRSISVDQELPDNVIYGFCEEIANKIGAICY